VIFVCTEDFVRALDTKSCYSPPSSLANYDSARTIRKMDNPEDTVNIKWLPWYKYYFIFTINITAKVPV